MKTTPLLTLVASFFIGHHTPVYCHSPRLSGVWQFDVVGFAFYYPDRIYLRYCPYPIEAYREDIDTLAHEILHIQHRGWSELEVIANEHHMGTVVGRKLRRLRAGLPGRRTPPLRQQGVRQGGFYQTGLRIWGEPKEPVGPSNLAPFRSNRNISPS